MVRRGIHVGDQILWLRGGIPCADDSPVSAAGVAPGSTICLRIRRPEVQCEWDAALPAPPGAMEITIKTQTGKSFTLPTHPAESVFEVKCRIEDKEGIPIDKLRLIFAGLVLEDGRTLSDYNMNTTRGSTVHIILRIRGS
jgi:hypothetical protein